MIPGEPEEEGINSDVNVATSVGSVRDVVMAGVAADPPQMVDVRWEINRVSGIDGNEITQIEEEVAAIDQDREEIVLQ